MIDRIVVRFCITLSITLLSACGGGSSGTPPTYSVAGSISNLTSSGLVLSNGAEKVSVPANATSISFPTQLPAGATYNINIVSQPLGFTDACILSNASGTVTGAAVANFDVSCHPAVAVVTTLAGSGNRGGANDTGTAASFSFPYGLAVDTSGNVIVADQNNVIRKITPQGVVTTIAGSGQMGHSDGAGTAASFSDPTCVTVDTAGNIYVGDTNNQLIRKITPDGIVTTLAGTGTIGSANGVGIAASFDAPFGITVDGAGNLYVADTGNELIREITPAEVVTTLAGSGNFGWSAGPGIPASFDHNGVGTSASFNGPWGLAADATGNVYVADNANNMIRKITASGVVTTLAGNGTEGSANGVGTAASFWGPVGVAVDSLGNIYVADNSNNMIRKITASGVVTTVAGGNSKGSANGVGAVASFWGPVGIAADNMGNVYVSEVGNNLIRKISPQ